MRVAIIDPSLFTPPYDAHLAAGMAALGHDVTISGRRLRPGEMLGSEQRHFSFVPFFYRFSESMPRWAGSARGLAKAIEHAADTNRLIGTIIRGKFDVVHYEWMPLPAIDGRAIARLKKNGIRVVFTVHDTDPFNNAPSSRAQIVGWRRALDRFDALIVHTPHSKTTLTGAGIPAKKILVIPHGLLSFGPTPIGETPKKTALFFGTLKPYKGIDVLITAFASMARKIEAHLVITGSSPDAGRRCIDLAQKLGIADSVTIDARFFGDDEVPSILARGSVVVFPYHRIDASGAFFTSLYYKKPFIASDIGVFRDLARDDRFPLVPPGNADALAAKLTDVFEHPESFARLERSAEAIRARIPSWEAIARMTVAAYETTHVE